MSRILIIVAVAMWLVMTLLSGAAIYYHGRYSDQLDANKYLQRDNVQQTAVIATQSFQFNRFNQIAAAAGQYTTTIRYQSDERQTANRDEVRQDEISRQCVPAGTAGRLLIYANRLRAGAMHSDTSQSNATSIASTSTGCRLTYAQAVYWIDPLLTAIDQANSQLAGIREIEYIRKSGE